MGVAVLRDRTTPLKQTGIPADTDLDAFRGLVIGSLLSLLIWSIAGFIVLGR